MDLDQIAREGKLSRRDFLRSAAMLGGFFLLGGCEKGFENPMGPDKDKPCEPTQVQIKIDFVDEGIEWEDKLWSSWFMVGAYLREESGYKHLGPYPSFSSYNVEPGTTITRDLWAPTIMDGRPMVNCGTHKVVFTLDNVLPSELVFYGTFFIPAHPLTNLYPEHIPAPYCQIRAKIIKPTHPYKVEPREYDFGRFQWGPDDIGGEKTFSLEIST